MRIVATILFIAVAASLTFTAAAQAKKEAIPAQKSTPQKEPANGSKSQPSRHTESEATKIDVAEAPVEKPALDTTAAPDDELTREIKKLLDVSNAVAIGVSTTENLLQQQKAANTDKNMDAFYSRFLQAFKTQRVHGLLENIFIKAYRDSYTLDEVKQLTDFYKTPLGKKSLAALPTILQKCQDGGRQLGVMLAMEIYQQKEPDQ